MTADDLCKLKARVAAAHEEFNLAVLFHEAWKPAAYDAQLHERMGTSYATQTFQVIRMALNREMLLALSRLWDKSGTALRMEEDIGKPLRDEQVISALAAERAANMKMKDVVSEIRKDLCKSAGEAIVLIDKYSRGGSHFSVREHLKRFRDERLAHHQISVAEAPETSATDEELEGFYQDNSKLICLLLHLVKATAFDPMEAAEVYAYYAKFFWAAVRGEQTVGHPSWGCPGGC